MSSGMGPPEGACGGTFGLSVGTCFWLPPPCPCHCFQAGCASAPALGGGLGGWLSGAADGDTELATGGATVATGGATVAAGAIVLDNVPDNATAIGVWGKR